MKKIFGLLMLTLLIGGGAGPVILNTGCDDLTGICDTQQEAVGMPGYDLKYLESWRKEGTFGILRFIYPDRTVFFVCTDRTLSYQGKLEKRLSGTVFTVSPQARLIWKYAAPKPSKAVLMGAGNSFSPLFEFNAKTTTIYQDRITLAYSEGLFGGYFIPGVEIKIPTLGNQSDDFNWVWNNFLLVFDYKVTYREMYR
jgi:hypothetical protein